MKTSTLTFDDYRNAQRAGRSAQSRILRQMVSALIAKFTADSAETAPMRLA